MMKKLLMLLLSLICCISILGCGADPKKEAQRLNTEYYENIKNIFSDWSKEVDPIVQTNSDFKSSVLQIAQITDSKTMPALNELKVKFDNEKSSTELKPLHDSLNNLFNTTFSFFAKWIEQDGFSNMNQVDANIELIRSTNLMLNARLLYENEYSLLVNKKSTYNLDLEHYNKIKQGDTYADIANILGMPGQLTYSSQGSFLWAESYEWVLGNKRVSAKFENNRLKIISQFNLQ